MLSRSAGEATQCQSQLIHYAVGGAGSVMDHQLHMCIILTPGKVYD